MARKVLSIETGIWWTKVAVIEPKKKNPAVSSVFYFETPEHSVEDGYIRDKDAFSLALKKALEEHEVEEKEVIFSLNSSKIVTREITIPAIKDNQIQNVIDTQAKDYFPMDVSDYSITYIKMKNLSSNGNVSTLEDEASETSVYMDEESEGIDVKEKIKKRKKSKAIEGELKLLLIAIPENLQNNYISLCEMSDLTFESFEYMASSAGSFIGHNFEGNNVVIQVVDQSTIVSLIVDGKLEFLRVAPYGYGTTISTILDNPVLGCKTEKEAFKFLTEHDVFNETPNPADFKNSDITDEEKLAKALASAFEDVADSLGYHKRVVNTALDYYKSQTKIEFTGQLHLIGDGLAIKGLKEAFTSQLSFELIEKDYFSFVSLSKNASAELFDIKAIDFISVIGASYKPVNLLPKGVSNSTASEEELRRVKAGFIAVCAVCALIVIYSSARNIYATVKHNQLTKRIEELQYIQVIYDENAAAGQLAQDFTNFDNSTKSMNEHLLEFIDELERKLPVQSYVQSIEISSETISINVVSDERPAVAQLLLNLKSIALIDNVDIKNLTESEQTDTSDAVWNYTVTARYNANYESEVE